MDEIIPTPQTIPASEPKYPEIEELKLNTNYLSSGKLSDLTQALGINMPSTGIKTRATADEVLFSIGTKLNNLTNQITNEKINLVKETMDQKFQEQNIEIIKMKNELIALNFRCVSLRTVFPHPNRIQPDQYGVRRIPPLPPNYGGH